MPVSAAFRAHAGPIVLEFPPGPRDELPSAAWFADELDRFLDQLPRDFDYAVELRDRALLTPAYAAVLARHGVAHTYNYWSAMPMPLAQAAVVAPPDSPFIVVRLLLEARHLVRGSARPLSRRSTAWSRPTRRCAAKSSS